MIIKFYYSDGSVLYYLSADRILHRLDGPAIEWGTVAGSWYINGKQLSEDKFKKTVLVMKLSGLLDG